MGILYDLSTKYKAISIVGMAKNAGKTTALNYLIEEAIDEGIVLGITSTGRDGETQDLVTGTEKPRVYLEEGMLAAVPSLLYEMADAGLEVIRKTKYSTAIGELLICRVREAGYVQIAGPVINAEQKLLCDDMLELGCELVLIDGAIDRKTIASPDTSDAIILSTGAVLSRTMSKVVEETAHIVNLYRTPELEAGTARELKIITLTTRLCLSMTTGMSANLTSQQVLEQPRKSTEPSMRIQDIYIYRVRSQTA